MKIRSSTKLKKLSNSVSVLRSIEDYNSKNCVKKRKKFPSRRNFEMKIHSSTKSKKLCINSSECVKFHFCSSNIEELCKKYFAN